MQTFTLKQEIEADNYAMQHTSKEAYIELLTEHIMPHIKDTYIREYKALQVRLFYALTFKGE
jgi:hypothetical protein